MNTGTPSPSHHEDNRFDILRLIAAWLVLFSHAFPLGGQPDREPLASTIGIDTLGGLGVAIFFVLSGYLVTLSLQRSPNLLVFLRRRAVRIYPALAAACLLCALALGPMLSELPWLAYFRHATTWDYLKTMNAFQIRYALPGVFVDTPLPHAVNGSLWSLPYELKCYLALALLTLLPLSLRAKVLLAFGLLLGLLLLGPPVPPANPLERFWGLDYYDVKLGLLFSLGAMYAIWRDHIQPHAWLGIALMIAALVLPHGRLQAALFYCGWGTLILWLALRGRWLPVLPKRIGDWSYGTYLYGFPVQQTLALLGLHHYGQASFVLGSTLLTLALAGLSWHLIERPALRWK